MHFAKQLEIEAPKAWSQAHKVLYEYYKSLPEKLWGKYLPDSLEEIQPLLRAVNHGCKSKTYQKVIDEVYWPRLRREHDGYITNKLGAYADDLGALANFFDHTWSKLASGLDQSLQASILNWTGFGLRSVGRLAEALEPMTAALKIRIQLQDWNQAATQACNLGELYQNTGNIKLAKVHAKQSVDLADQSQSAYQRISKRTAYADILHQAGEIEEALSLFEYSEELQRKSQPEFPFLHGFSGMRYLDILLTVNKSLEVIHLSRQTIETAKASGWLLDIALNQLILGRAYLKQEKLGLATSILKNAITDLRSAGVFDYLIQGLLTQAILYFKTKEYTASLQNLRETYEIAEPSGMRLHLTDYHLEMARLILAIEADPAQYPEATPDRDQRTLPPELADPDEPGILTLEDHITEAARLIEETGYHRRDAELAELKQEAGMPC